MKLWRFFHLFWECSTQNCAEQNTSFNVSLKMESSYSSFIHIFHINRTEEETNERQVRPYRPVSWSPTHRGIIYNFYIQYIIYNYVYKLLCVNKCR